LGFIEQQLRIESRNDNCFQEATLKPFCTKDDYDELINRSQNQNPSRGEEIVFCTAITADRPILKNFAAHYVLVDEVIQCDPRTLSMDS
jgi:hypothetical protein